jgi:hypothetical protein
MQSPFISVPHGQSGEVHLFPNFLPKLPAKSWLVMVSRAKYAEFRGQRGGSHLTHNSVTMTLHSPIILKKHFFEKFVVYRIDKIKIIT